MTVPENLRIRSMIESDLDAVIALERQSDAAPHWSRAAYLAVLEDPSSSPLSSFGLVAVIGSEVAGFAVVRVLIASDGGEAELESIVVAPGLRGQGIGASLLAESIFRARSRGARRLDLEVRASNVAAIRLYDWAGFGEIGRRRRYYSGPDEDAILLRVIL